jgi:hypothetical protein
VHYERGGIDHSFHILVAKLAKNEAKPKIIWSAVGSPLKDYAEFLDSLRSGDWMTVCITGIERRSHYRSAAVGGSTLKAMRENNRRRRNFPLHAGIDYKNQAAEPPRVPTR